MITIIAAKVQHMILMIQMAEKVQNLAKTIQMTPIIVARVQHMIPMIHMAEKVQSLAKMAPWVNMDPEMTSMMMMTMVR